MPKFATRREKLVMVMGRRGDINLGDFLVEIIV